MPVQITYSDRYQSVLLLDETINTHQALVRENMAKLSDLHVNLGWVASIPGAGFIELQRQIRDLLAQIVLMKNIRDSYLGMR